MTLCECLKMEFDLVQKFMVGLLNAYFSDLSLIHVVGDQGFP